MDGGRGRGRRRMEGRKGGRKRGQEGRREGEEGGNGGGRREEMGRVSNYKSLLLPFHQPADDVTLQYADDHNWSRLKE